MFTAKRDLSDTIESLSVFPYKATLKELDSENFYYKTASGQRHHSQVIHLLITPLFFLI